MITRAKALLCLTMLLTALTVQAQLELCTEGQLTASTGEHTPLWLNANKYGLSSLEKTNGYLRAGLFRSMEEDSLRHWAFAGGADVTIAAGNTSTLIIQQLYGELRWLKGRLTIGSKQQPMELKNQQLSSGAQTLGINARPVPSIRLSLPAYWWVPFTKGWLGLKGHIAYGMQTDDRWQREFTEAAQKRTEHAKLHTKAGYLRIGKLGKPVSVEMGLEMACQFGGTSFADIGQGMTRIKNEDGLKGMARAFIPSGGDVGENLYENKAGNHVGSYLLRVNLDFKQWYLALYADHFFEDHSQMFYLDYNGYGEGDEFNVWKHNRYFVYDFKDIMLGAELKLKNITWLDNIVVEYIYSKYQSGPIYHDRTRNLADHIGGRDNYYNHYMHTGWQHWGQVMGNPLYRSPLYNTDHQVAVENNRFWAWHLGLSGHPIAPLHYRVLATWQRGWGTYDLPFVNPEHNFSWMAEAEYKFAEHTALAGWNVKAAVGMDRGKILGNNFGGQITIAKRFALHSK